MLSDKQMGLMEQDARKLGEERARGEAQWYVDGNTPIAHIHAMLKGIREGDPAVTDLIGQSPLSGEFAGDYSIQDLARDFELGDSEREVAVLDELAQAYEDGYWDTIVGAVEQEVSEWL